MRPRPFLLLLAGVVLALMAAGKADAEKEPVWSYQTGDYVRSVAISADGEYITAGSSDDKVYLFDKDSSTPLWNYSTGGAVRAIAISADGEYIAAGAFGDKVYLFDKDSSTPLWSADPIGLGGIYSSVTISADGEYITTGSGSGWVYLFGKNSSTPLWSVHPVGLGVDVAISADGEYIAAGNKVNLFNRDNSTPLWSYTTENLYSVAISPDGEYIVAGSGDDKVYLFGKDNSTPIWSYTTGHNVRSVAISADGEYIAAGSDDNKVYLLDNNRPPTATIDSSTPSSARFDAEVTFSGTGSDSDGTVVAYEWSCDIDGFLSDEEDFSTTGLTVGTHNISFRVQDNDGEWSSWFPGIQLWIYAVPVAIAGADVSTTPTVPVQFNGQGTDEDGTIAKYEWDFDGNGVYDWSSTENGRELNIYNNVGVYTAMLRVTDNDGFTDTDTVVITVTEKIIQIDDEG
ncbi:MAG: PKD domain-containing protein, partial [Candidatus Poseidoniia archaeon]|nr:PKD domain-containing protein [Candidatus Poseidoniia archaeon]